jgi:DNA-binding transcriptional LysR family regulator
MTMRLTLQRSLLLTATLAGLGLAAAPATLAADYADYGVGCLPTDMQTPSDADTSSDSDDADPASLS